MSISDNHCRQPAVVIRSTTLMLAVIAALTVTAGPVPALAEPFEIRVLDEQTGRGVPLVELATVNDVRYVTDSAGRVAFHEPGLMGETVFFHIDSHGYEFPADGFGFRGRRVQVTSGGSITLRIKRLNIAERLYRVTGAGIYRDSVLLNKHVPLQQPLLNAGVLGSDSVLTAVFRGQVHWFWGDTNFAAYPLGNFHVPGAVSQLPASGGLPLAEGVNLDYFVDQRGRASETCRMPGTGPTWIDGLLTVGSDSDQRMFARYVKIRPPLEAYERGIVEFDPAKHQFAHRLTLTQDQVLFPNGHSFRASEAGSPDTGEYIYFANPWPIVRVRASVESVTNPDHYQTWTCLTQGSRSDQLAVDRDASGQLKWGWKSDTVPLDHRLEDRLVSAELLQPDERILQLTAADNSRSVTAHRGSVAFNRYCNRWIMILTELSGEHSHLGDVWYTSADRLTGPWRPAVRIAVHEKYSFYNPRHHPMFDEDGGRLIYFEGTYTTTFSGQDAPTPRYDYNQLMYRLDLSHPALNPRSESPR